MTLGMVFCAAQLPPSAPPDPISEWRNVPITDAFSRAHPLQVPVVLSDAVIWRKLGDAGLTYTPLDGAPSQRYDWLLAPPKTWHAVQNDGHILLAWVDVADQLWVAALADSGEQLTAPIAIGGNAVLQAELQPTADGAALFWLENRALFVTLLDSQARPRPPIRLETNIAQFTTGTDALNRAQIHLAWVAEGQIWAGDVLILGDDISIRPENSRPLSALNLSAEQWLDTLALINIEASQVVVWGISASQRPDTIALNAVWIQQGATSELTLPNAPPLRWASVHPTQNALLVTGYQDEKWRALHLIPQLHDGVFSIEENIYGAPANASPVGAWNDTYAWVSLDAQREPFLEIRTLDPRYGVLERAAVPFDWRAAMRQGIERSPLMVAWFVLPLIVAWRHEWFVLPLAMALYWLAKGILPFGLFAAYPTPLLGLDNIPLAPFSVGFLALFLISRLASIVGYLGWGSSPDSVRHAAYFLTDAFLTFAIFSISVE